MSKWVLPSWVWVVIGMIGIMLLSVAFGATITYNSANERANNFIEENCVKSIFAKEGEEIGYTLEVGNNDTAREAQAKG